MENINTYLIFGLFSVIYVLTLIYIILYTGKKQHKERNDEIKLLLNDALNKAMVGKNRIKGVVSSNKIAEFVNDYVNHSNKSE